MTLRELHEALGRLIAECDSAAPGSPDFGHRDYPDLPVYSLSPHSARRKRALAIAPTGIDVQTLRDRGADRWFKAFILAEGEGIIVG
jgi:hypothetical protein